MQSNFINFTFFSEKTVVAQMTLEKNLYLFHKKMNQIKNSSILKKSPEERHCKNLEKLNEENEKNEKENQEKSFQKYVSFVRKFCNFSTNSIGIKKKLKKKEELNKKSKNKK